MEKSTRMFLEKGARLRGTPTTKHFCSTTKLTITIRNVHQRALISSASTSALKGFQWLKGQYRSFSHVRSGFMSKCRGNLSAPPALGSYVRRWERWVRTMGVEHVGIDSFFKRSSHRVDSEPANIFHAECSP